MNFTDARDQIYILLAQPNPLSINDEHRIKQMLAVMTNEYVNVIVQRDLAMSRQNDQL